MKAIKASKPIVLAFNMRRKQFDLLGMKHFEKLQEGLQSIVENSALFPILVPDRDTTIESRTRYIESFLPEVRNILILLTTVIRIVELERLPFNSLQHLWARFPIFPA